MATSCIPDLRDVNIALFVCDCREGRVDIVWPRERDGGSMATRNGDMPVGFIVN